MAYEREEDGDRGEDVLTQSRLTGDNGGAIGLKTEAEQLHDSIIQSNLNATLQVITSTSTPSSAVQNRIQGHSYTDTSRSIDPVSTLAQPQPQSTKRPNGSPPSTAKSTPPKRRRLQFTFKAGDILATSLPSKVTIAPTNNIISTPVSNGQHPRTSFSGDTTMVGDENGDDVTIFKTPLPPTPQTSDISTALRSLPIPILLLIQAQIHHSSLVTPIGRARTISPPRPSSPAATTAAEIVYTKEWIEWMRKSGASVAALRSVIARSGENAGIAGSRLVLRARCELAEILVREMEGTAEAEKVISKGLAAAKKHEAFADYKYRLYSLQAELSVAQGNIKFAKTTIQRAIADILSTPILAHPFWLYHYYFTLASITTTAQDYPGALLNLREVERLAERRGDDEMKWASRVLIARLALGQGEFRTAESMIMQVAKMMGLSDQLAPAVKADAAEDHKDDTGIKTDQGFLGRQLRVQFLLVYCLYYAQNGNVKLAKEKLKMAHVLLDEKVSEEGEAEGWTSIPILSPDAVQPYSAITSASSTPDRSPMTASSTKLAVKMTTSPRSLIYSFAFLASVAIHRDPYGSKPRSKLFANEGLRTLDNKLAGNEAWMPAQTPPNQIPAYARVVAKMKVDLLVFSAELDIMRSAFTSAEALLSSAIATARAHAGLWESFQRRITLAHGTLAQAKGQDELALQCFEVAVRLPNSQRDRDLITLAQVSILMIKIAQGSRVRITDEGSASASAKRPSLLREGDRFSLADLTRMAKDIVASTSHAVPSLQLVGELVQALTKGEIIKAKQHLSNALNISNSSLANHAKALMLALLANLFLHTRNDQAQKMLKAAFTILRGMGSQVMGEQDNTVGNAKLGLWVGEHLLESYEKYDEARAQKQRLYNATHRQVLAKEVR